MHACLLDIILYTVGELYRLVTSMTNLVIKCTKEEQTEWFNLDVVINKDRNIYT